jgi:hypothetical protein
MQGRREKRKEGRKRRRTEIEGKGIRVNGEINEGKTALPLCIYIYIYITVHV